MAKRFTGTITAPNDRFNGQRWGVQFKNGTGEAQDLPAPAVAWFKRRGYTLEAESTEKPLDKRTNDELREIAAAEGIDLGDATKKAELVEAIEAARAARQE